MAEVKAEPGAAPGAGAGAGVEGAATPEVKAEPGKRVKREFALPGQTREPPMEIDPLRRFYSSLREQVRGPLSPRPPPPARASARRTTPAVCRMKGSGRKSASPRRPPIPTSPPAPPFPRLRPRALFNSGSLTSVAGR